MSDGERPATRIRGLRGATRAARDDSDSIRAVTRELLTEMMRRNGLDRESLVSAFFTVTPDLVSEFPARAARELGWDEVAMLCSTEIPVPGSIDRVVRVLLHAELPKNSSVRHVYLNGAEELRPDL
jgi:chorismate mutase